MKVLYERDCPGVSDRIRQVRGERSPQELATSAGLSVGYWYRLEGDDSSRVPFKTLEAVAGALGASVDDLIKSTEPMMSEVRERADGE